MFMRGILLSLAFAFAGLSCHTPVEDLEHHVVHRGEMAKLTVKDGDNVYLMLDKKDAYHAEEALASKDLPRLDAMVASGKALKLPAGTLVKVLRDSYADRKVEVEEGPLAGKTGWVVWENLKSLDRTDR